MKRFILLFSALLCAGVFNAPAQVADSLELEYIEELPPATINAKGKKKIKHYGREWREKYRLIYNFNKVYPYALVGRKLMHQVDSTIEADGLDKRNRDRYIKNVEKELFRLFEKDIRNTTISQGFLLTRLIDRECGMTVYDIIYNPKGQDAKTEELVKIWESGEAEWDYFYYQVFWEDPPKTKIPTDKLSTKALIDK